MSKHEERRERIGKLLAGGEAFTAASVARRVNCTAAIARHDLQALLQAGQLRRCRIGRRFVWAIISAPAAVAST